jgi:uncharacterized protein
MLATILVAVVLFGLLFAGMAIGVILANKPVKGSCGGLGAAGLDRDCEICGGDRNRCREEKGGQPPRNARQSPGASRGPQAPE